MLGLSNQCAVYRTCVGTFREPCTLVKIRTKIGFHVSSIGTVQVLRWMTQASTILTVLGRGGYPQHCEYILTS
jgi:hypothetical protein